MRLLIATIVALSLMLATVGRAGGEDHWRNLIDQYSWDGDKAEAVMLCESGGSATAINGRYIGLFQVDTVLHRWTEEELLVPEVNVAAAYELYTRRGWGPWPECGLLDMILPDTGTGGDLWHSRHAEWMRAGLY